MSLENNDLQFLFLQMWNNNIVLIFAISQAPVSKKINTLQL